MGLTPLRQGTRGVGSWGRLAGCPGGPGSEVTVTSAPGPTSDSQAAQPNVGKLSCLPSFLGVGGRAQLGCGQSFPFPPAVHSSPALSSEGAMRAHALPACPCSRCPLLLDDERPVGDPGP